MSRFFVAKENVRGNLIHIDGREARHILNVMRMKRDDRVTVFDGTGKEYTGFIKTTKPTSLIVEIITTNTPKAGGLPQITLAQSIPKKEKMDYIVEKATELGIYSIIPVISERTVVAPGEEGANTKIERWKRLALEAAKQCGRTDIPGIKDIRKFYDIIYEVGDFDLILMAHLSEDTIPLKEAISDFKSGKIIVFIGPEGDFTPDEITMARNNTNCRFVTLGKRVLKSDTAGLYALSVLSYELSR